MLSGSIGEIKFGWVTQLLRNNSLVDEAVETRRYATHPVFRQWVYYSQVSHTGTDLSRLSMKAVAWAVRGSSTCVLEVDCT
jgi:hypothetical protein